MQGSRSPEGHVLGYRRTTASVATKAIKHTMEPIIVAPRETLPLYILSDLNVDVNRDWKECIQSDLDRTKSLRGATLDAVFVMAGNLCPLQEYDLFTESLNVLCKTYRHVVVVPGNKEFYNCGYDKALKMFRKACAETNAIGLCRNTAVIDSVQYVGTTLWTDRVDSEDDYYTMNDSKYSPDLTASYVQCIHKQDVDWLSSQLLEYSVVVTHHPPTRDLVHHLLHQPLSSRLYTDLPWLLYRTRMWICGNTHTSTPTPMKVKIHGCYCVVHPLVYGTENSMCKPYHMDFIPYQRA